MTFVGAKLLEIRQKKRMTQIQFCYFWLSGMQLGKHGDPGTHGHSDCFCEDETTTAVPIATAATAMKRRTLRIMLDFS